MLVNKTTTIMRENRLLEALPAFEYERLVPYLNLVSLSLGQVVYEAEEPITQVYFPHNSLVSLIITTENGSTVEVGIVGNEGMVGMPVILGSNTTTTTGIVQIAGTAMQMNADILKIEFERGGTLQKLLLRYLQALYTQVSQAAVCNRLHTLEARLARWLLTVSDRLQSDELPLTQEYISHMLGVRRSGVTVAAGSFSNQGIISYNRGHITILNREALEATSCECYRLIKRELARLLGN
ncbi:MAG: Crp/Fnr family transcriptional regulator [Aulosira sp. ZfuVER01]|nr:Crp/Fnr family transcriptional regulator [Aulosira sp. ZfuVER01]MDZ8000344.1 Crp/Fnr family transcriptional regulator [Aulosira sp. DedVER01a]MDZ8050254.1 Crp/Fnr family transcriptional regulator [Aulosira sp. ZfuCHP01]